MYPPIALWSWRYLILLSGVYIPKPRHEKQKMKDYPIIFIDMYAERPRLVCIILNFKECRPWLGAAPISHAVAWAVLR